MGKIKYILLMFILFVLISATAYAKDVKSSDLIDSAKEYDGKVITYTGEVIGDIMKRGDYAWINVSDGDNAVGVWVPYEETKKIKYPGIYGYKGDIIRVNGVFNRACAEHGGDFDIHSQNIEIVQNGSIIDNPLNSVKKYAAAVLALISFVLSAIMLKKQV